MTLTKATTAPHSRHSSATHAARRPRGSRKSLGSSPQLSLELPPPLTITEKPPQPPTLKPKKQVVVTDRIGAIDQILNTKDVLRITGVHRTTLYRWTSQGRFPKKRRFHGHGRSIGWMRSDIEQWMAASREVTES